jgi:hypothetical protein
MAKGLSDDILVLVSPSLVLSLQLCLSNIPASCYTAIIGFALGLLYRIECLPFHRLRVPQWLSTGCGRLFSPLLSGSLFATIAGVHDAAGRRVGGGGRVGSGAGAAAAARARQPGGGQPGYEVVNAEPEGEILNDAAAFGGYAAPMQPADVAPDPAAVAQLTGMGFSDERARAALAASGNNVAQATNRLLGQ